VRETVIDSERETVIDSKDRDREGRERDSDRDSDSSMSSGVEVVKSKREGWCVSLRTSGLGRFRTKRCEAGE